MQVKSPFEGVEGWKSKATCVAGTLSGLSMIVGAFTGEFINTELLITGVSIILGAWGLIGLAHKADKFKQVLLDMNKTKNDRSGKMDLRLIILIFAVCGGLLFASGCTTFKKIYQPPEQPICDRDEAKNSLICKYSREVGIEPENIRDVFLDARDLYIVVKPEKAAEIKEVTTAMREMLKKNPFLTPAQLFTWVQNNQGKFRAMVGIMNRRMPWMANVDEIFDPFDAYMINSLLDKIEEFL